MKFEIESDKKAAFWYQLTGQLTAVMIIAYFFKYEPLNNLVILTFIATGVIAAILLFLTALLVPVFTKYNQGDEENFQIKLSKEQVQNDPKLFNLLYLEAYFFQMGYLLLMFGIVIAFANMLFGG